MLEDANDAQKRYLASLSATGRNVATLSNLTPDEKLRFANLGPVFAKERSFHRPAEDAWNDEAFAPTKEGYTGPIEERLDAARIEAAAPDRRLEISNAVEVVRRARLETDLDLRARRYRDDDVANALQLLKYYAHR